MTRKSTRTDVFYSNFFGVPLCVFQVHCPVHDITFVSCYYNWSFFRNILPQLKVPCFHFFERVEVSNIVYQQSTYIALLDQQPSRLLTWRALIIILCECMVLLLASRVPDVQLNRSFSHVYFFVQKTCVDRTHLVFVKDPVYETEWDWSFADTS